MSIDLEALAAAATPVGDLVLDERGQVHNWLYSFLPVGKQNFPALVGFCKNCRHTFYYVMKIHDISWIDSKAFKQFREEDAEIPKYGCFPTSE